jgi:hypothetical protein
MPLPSPPVLPTEESIRTALAAALAGRRAKAPNTAYAGRAVKMQIPRYTDCIHCDPAAVATAHSVNCSDTGGACSHDISAALTQFTSAQKKRGTLRQRPDIVIWRCHHHSVCQSFMLTAAGRRLQKIGCDSTMRLGMPPCMKCLAGIAAGGVLQTAAPMCAVPWPPAACSRSRAGAHTGGGMGALPGHPLQQPPAAVNCDAHASMSRQAGSPSGVWLYCQDICTLPALAQYL